MMFTWRKQFENDEKTFLDSKYYSTIQDLIKDTRLSDLLEKENLELYMCLHDNMIPYKDKFITTNSRIKIVDKTENSIQELLRECKYLITDYSSVAFDFAYMKKSHYNIFNLIMKNLEKIIYQKDIGIMKMVLEK